MPVLEELARFASLDQLGVRLEDAQKLVLVRDRATFEDPPRCLRCDTSCKAPVVVQLLGERLSPSAAFRSVAT